MAGAQCQATATRDACVEEAFYIKNMRFDLDTLRVPNRSRTPISKSNDVLGQSEDIWGARGPRFRPIWGVPGAWAGLTNTCFLSF